MINHFDALKLDREVVCSLPDRLASRVIKKAFRKIAKKLHPDKRRNRPLSDEEKDRWLAVQEAYKILMQAPLRRSHNAELAEKPANPDCQTCLGSGRLPPTLLGYRAKCHCISE